jgi:hypothetical protein
LPPRAATVPPADFLEAGEPKPDGNADREPGSGDNTGSADRARFTRLSPDEGVLRRRLVRTSL